jgi:hypothetical protein
MDILAWFLLTDGKKGGEGKEKTITKYQGFHTNENQTKRRDR